MSYPDSEALLVSWYGDALPAATVCTELPANLDSVLPVVRFTRIGGADKDVRLDVATIDIDCFDVGSVAASALCAAVLDLALYQLYGDVGGGVVSRVQTQQGPHRRPYDNTTLRRYGATVRITLHS